MTSVRPLCFAPEAWAEWTKSHRLVAAAANPGAAKVTFCTDCTPDRQARMKTEGRCAYPETTFRRNGGAWVGRQPRKPEK